jgi:hypothetical protein
MKSDDFSTPETLGEAGTNTGFDHAPGSAERKRRLRRWAVQADRTPRC